MAVREGLLALLDDGRRHGYQLKTDFEQATGGVWPLNVGQVYTTLERLERDGLVAVAEDNGQKSYELTADGREELGAWWTAVPVDDPPPRDELMLKVLMAIEHGPDARPRRDHPSPHGLVRPPATPPPRAQRPPVVVGGPTRRGRPRGACRSRSALARPL